jgi:hypothetical protein
MPLIGRVLEKLLGRFARIADLKGNSTDDSESFPLIPDSDDRYPPEYKLSYIINELEATSPRSLYDDFEEAGVAAQNPRACFS